MKINNQENPEEILLNKENNTNDNNIIEEIINQSEHLSNNNNYISFQDEKEEKLSEYIQVFCRFRPPSESELSFSTNNSVILLSPKQLIITQEKKLELKKDYTFDALFENDTSKELFYQKTSKPIVNAVLQGYNGGIICYGETGTGKSYTLKEILPQVEQQIFEYINEADGNNELFKIDLAMIEIYKEQVNDLIDLKNTNLNLIENKSKKLIIDNLTHVGISSKEQLNQMINKGLYNRNSRDINYKSKSHFIIMITVYHYYKNENYIKIGKLNLVDLEGSERISNIEEGNLEEQKLINKSLIALSIIVQNISNENDNITYAPYRDSKLTRIISDCFGGNAYTSLILHCSKHECSTVQTRNTLMFGEKVKKIKNYPVINIEKINGKGIILGEIFNLENNNRGGNIDLGKKNLNLNNNETIRQMKEKINFLNIQIEQLNKRNALLENEKKNFFEKINNGGSNKINNFYIKNNINDLHELLNEKESKEKELLNDLNSLKILLEEKNKELEEIKINQNENIKTCEDLTECLNEAGNQIKNKEMIIEELKNKIEINNKEINDLNNIINELKEEEEKEKNNYENIIQELKDNINNLNNKINELNNKLNLNEKEINALNNEKISQLKSKENYEKRINQLKEQINKLKEETEKEKNNYENIIQELKDNINNLNNKINELNNKLNLNEKEINALNNEKISQLKSKENYEKRINQLKEQINKLKEENNPNKIREKTLELDNLNKKINKLQEENDKLKNKLDIITKEQKVQPKNSDLINENNILKNQIKLLEKNYDNISLKNKELLQQINQNHNQRNRPYSESKDVKELNNLKQENKRLNEKIISLEKHKKGEDKLKNEIKNKDKTHEEFETEFHQIIQDNDEKIKEIKNLKKQIDNLNRENTRNKNTIDNLRKEITDKNKIIEDNKKQNNNYSPIYNNTRSNTSQYQTSYNNNRYISDIKQKNELITKENNENKKVIENLRKEIETKTKQLEENNKYRQCTCDKTKIEKLKKEINIKNNTINDYRIKLDNLQKELSSKDKIITDYKNSYYMKTSPRNNNFIIFDEQNRNKNNSYGKNYNNNNNSTSNYCYNYRRIYQIKEKEDENNIEILYKEINKYKEIIREKEREIIRIKNESNNRCNIYCENQSIAELQRIIKELKCENNKLKEELIDYDNLRAEIEFIYKRGGNYSFKETNKTSLKLAYDALVEENRQLKQKINKIERNLNK